MGHDPIVFICVVALVIRRRMRSLADPSFSCSLRSGPTAKNLPSPAPLRPCFAHPSNARKRQARAPTVTTPQAMIGVGTKLALPLPPNRTGAIYASGSPVDGV